MICNRCYNANLLFKKPNMLFENLHSYADNSKWGCDYLLIASMLENLHFYTNKKLLCLQNHKNKKLEHDLTKEKNHIKNIIYS